MGPYSQIAFWRLGERGRCLIFILKFLTFKADYPYQWIDCDIFDAEGKQFCCRLEVNQGDADANTGAWGTLRDRFTKRLLVKIEDKRTDCENLVTLCSSENFVEFDEFVDDDTLDQYSFLTNEYHSEHQVCFFPNSTELQLEKITSVIISTTETAFFVPLEIRVKFTYYGLKLVFSKIFPDEILSVIASYAPAYIPYDAKRRQVGILTNSSISEVSETEL